MPAIPVLSWFDKNTVKHLRLPFSFHLMPVFLFALSQAEAVQWTKAIIAFLILHLLIYPASNGYNSFQDKDETSIGGLKNPPAVTMNLFYATLLMDLAGCVLAYFVSQYFAIFVLIYIAVSRAYSYRKLRLKKNALTGFLTVFIFQGAFTFMMCASAFADFQPDTWFTPANIICMSVASLFIGSVYPLTQIYQHEADKKDGVITISYMLGYNGTFVFSGLMFSTALVFLFFYFDMKHQRLAFVLFCTFMLPVVAKLLTWFSKVRGNKQSADYENTMAMNLLASSCMNLYFFLLILNERFGWF
jgi:1,4-dihydroxy-2-naphthoate polyprenyltransferase